MTKAERDELRRIIRQRTKVLRSDIDARRAELVAELDQRLADQYAADMQRWDGVQTLVAEAVRAANRTVNDLYRNFYGRELWGDKHDKGIVVAMDVPGPKADRSKERAAGIRDIDAKVAQARVELERREVTLLEELAVGTLESAEARDFLARIPTVGELVPSYRLNQITNMEQQ